MTELRIETIEMPTAPVGGHNPLPPMFASGNVDKVADVTRASDEIRANAGYGRIDTVCPYLIQDRYSRDRTMAHHQVAVLENAHLRATFLLNAGGRLWSLVHKDSESDLLYTNPIFQPANLALRNAWFAGGVEWNIGTIGHTPGTCEPIHAARVRGDEGEPVLRLYEFERIRRVVFSLDVHLPADSDLLDVFVRIVNPNDHSVPMYWWSNMAVPQTSRTRVLAPASEAWNYSYDEVLRLVPVEAGDGMDVSYPARADDAADFFFDIGPGTQPWIAAVDESGSGVFQTSTARLMGRKLFRWGSGAGGRRWQEWLSGLGDGYAEIQAGLARTQFEHLPMPAGAQWSWLETYGRLDLPSQTAHADWATATAGAQQSIVGRVDAALLESKHAAAQALADREPEELLHLAGGWGALEDRIRARSGEPLIRRPGTPFSDSCLGVEQEGWLTALETGQWPEPGAAEFPASLHLHPVWEAVLQHSTGWLAPAVVGLIKACAGDLDGAKAAWIASVGRSPSAFAWRNLGSLAARSGDLAPAVTSYQRALELAPDEPALVVEALRIFLDAGEPERVLDLIDAASVEVREHGRIRLLEARAALGAGDLARCGAILTSGLAVPDLREGEDSLAELWWDYQARLMAADQGRDPRTEPDPALRLWVAQSVGVPANLDFRMRAGNDRADA